MKKIILLTLAITFTLLLTAQENNTSGFTSEETAVKSVVDRFLTAAGNYEIDSMRVLFTENANIAGASLRNGEWFSYTIPLEDFFKTLQSETNPKKYTEPVSEYIIHISESMLAFVKADAEIVRNDTAVRNNYDYFTLIKKDGAWKILNGSYVSVPVD